jgi:hypothetical protein
MPANASAAYGMYSHQTELHQVVHTLNQAGFGMEDICMMVSPTHPIATTVKEAGLFNTDSAANGLTAGMIGWLSEFGAVVIPTVGFFIRSQDFFHALVAMDDSSAFCGRSRSLVGLGFSDYDAQRLENQLRDVGVLVYVTCPESAQAEWAVEVLRRTGAEGTASLAREAAAGAAA